jgi:hypothetical protein
VKKAAAEVGKTLGVKLGGAIGSACDLAYVTHVAIQDFAEGKWGWGVDGLIAGIATSGVVFTLSVVGAKNMAPDAITAVKHALHADQNLQATTKRGKIERHLQEDALELGEEAMQLRPKVALESFSLASGQDQHDESARSAELPKVTAAPPSTWTLRILHLLARSRLVPAAMK